MSQNESPKPSAHTQQKESQGKERTKNNKSRVDNQFKEVITVERIN